jgi:hypothetical protein
MVSCFDFDRWVTRRPKSFWQRLKEGFSPDREPTPVVCIPPGARLRLNGIQESLKARFPLGSCEDAVFTQISADASQCRDALCFATGATILVQWLPEGQRVRILRLCSQEDVEPALEQSARAHSLTTGLWGSAVGTPGYRIIGAGLGIPSVRGGPAADESR